MSRRGGVPQVLGLVGVVVLAGCRERAQAVQSAADLRQLVRQRIAQVERATGLTFKRPPVVEQRTRAQMKDYVVRKLDEELPAAELAGIEATYRLFGLLPDRVDLRRTLVDLLTEQVAGYYEPDSGALYVATDLAGIDSFVVRTTVSHELVHALQDQYTNLDSILGVKRQNDRRLAAQAVLEGQATVAQTLVMMPEQSLARLPSFWDSRSVVRRQQATMREFAAAPFWLREMLVFPYLGGADFVRAFRLRHPDRHPFGAEMPVSTEQILHPDRYAAGDVPTELAFHDGGRDVVYEDGLGEFEIRVLFIVLLDDSTEAVAPRLAAGWDGDRYQLLATGAGGEAHALVWYSVWDSEADAREFAEGLGRAWKRRGVEAGARADRRYEIWIGSIAGMPGVRLVDAPADWAAWREIPGVRIVR